MTRPCPVWIWLTLALVAVLLAWLRPIDHDESQYVAAAMLSAAGGLPYRDYAYLQTPLQPLLFAPVAAIAGAWTWPALRVVNALLGIVAIACIHRAARVAGAAPTPALAAALLFAGTDILLFSIGTARNDALPVALLAAALVGIVRLERGDTGRRLVVGVGFALAAAAAAKVSYALPAIAYGAYLLVRRPRVAAWLSLGALPMVALVGALWATAPGGFIFGTLTFPARAPAEYYAARPWKLSLAAKGIDTLKFLALGAALPAIWIVARQWRTPGRRVMQALALAGLVAALMPEPTWRQYLLPALPPLFVLLAMVWTHEPPGQRTRGLLVVFAIAGLVPSILALTRTGTSMGYAASQGALVKQAMDTAGVRGPVATLSPQILAATGRLPDPVFATGPFYFRSRALLDAAAERRLHLMSGDRPRLVAPAVLTGGEGAWSSGDDALDARLAKAARAAGYREVPAGRWRLFVRP
ncbi:hypothetical protein ASE75_04760 [Sphingomonas sp. Leaf17]|uniref:glycosyltransferase family 39 protein n=1 Tax=Sphingomonas sp. Leaf17 TaxID=1735683 RepID=UPI0006FBB01A|nr:glycosyltransferase family 39 protein [Sphingomonas sp. Leaf17]KQM65573.1 hypothetical protein ASE75_04760 [Sphingomonas sp. Leaf17]